MTKSYKYLTLTGKLSTIDKESSKLGKIGWRVADIAINRSGKKRGREYVVVTMEKEERIDRFRGK